MSSELSTGRTIFILAVVVGCFAVLWPKVFYPMLAASVKQSGPAQGVYWRDSANAHHLTQLCFLLEESQYHVSEFKRWSDQDCLECVRKQCGVTLSEKVLENFRLSKDKSNMTNCLHQRFDITLQKVLATAPPTTRVKPYTPQAPIHPHARPERPSHLHPEVMHPALREKGRTMPQRTIEKQARPGPMPGVRPPMGGGGHMVPPQPKGSGAMGIIMPLYTVGIVIFFVYTIMKVLFKKDAEEDSKEPKLKDFHLDPEHRKYVFAEEYLDNSNASHRDLLRRHDREASKQRRRQDSSTHTDTKIEDEQMDQLRRRLEETERAMEKLMSQMGSVTDKLTAAKITEVLSQAQAQARILKDAAEGASDDDFTTSEAFTNTLSEDFSLPLALQRHLEELKVKDIYLKGTSAGILAPPPIPPHEAASLSDRGAPEQNPKAVDSTPLPATNDPLLNSHQELNDEILADENGSEKDAVEVEELPLEKEYETSDRRTDILNVNLSPVVDFPIKVTSSLNDEIKENKKQTEEQYLSSDIALHYKPEEHSDKEGSSDETETGADISELKSFADDGALPSASVVPLPVVEEQALPEATYTPVIEEYLDDVPKKVLCENTKPLILLKPIEVIPARPIAVEESLPEATYTPVIEECLKDIPKKVLCENTKPLIILKPIEFIPARPITMEESPETIQDKNVEDKNIVKDWDVEAIPKPTEILPLRSIGVEHGTQTDATNPNQQLSVLNMRTTYQIDKKEQTKAFNVKDVEDKINEIILDATLPMDTQLLVKEAQTGSSVSGNIDIDLTDLGDEPCVITSQVSLAFVGMEQNEHEGPLMIIVPEKRSQHSKLDSDDCKLSEEVKNVKDSKDVCVSPYERSSEGSTIGEDSINIKTSTKQETPKLLMEDEQESNINIKDAKETVTDEIHFQSKTVPTVTQKTVSLKSVELTPELPHDNIKHELTFRDDNLNIETPTEKETPKLLIEHEQQNNINIQDVKETAANQMHFLSETVPTVLQKTISLESVELTPELLHGNIKHELNKDFEESTIERPPSPVPPLILDKIAEASQDQTFTTLFSNSISSQVPEIKAEGSLFVSSEVYSLANSIVATITEEALERVSNLPISEWTKLKNKNVDEEEPEEQLEINFERQKVESETADKPFHVITGELGEHRSISKPSFTSSYVLHTDSEILKPLEQRGDIDGSGDTELGKQTIIGSETPHQSFRVITSELGEQRSVRNPSFTSSYVLHTDPEILEQPGDVGGSEDVECTGGDSPIYMATVRCFSTISPVGPAPLCSDSPFRLEHQTNNTDNSTQIEPPTYIIEGSPLVADDGCGSEENASQQYPQLTSDSTRMQEEAMKSGNIVGGDLDMNHKG